MNKTWKLTEQQKAEIIAKRATGRYGVVELAKEYGVNKSTISKLGKRREQDQESIKSEVTALEADIQKQIIAKGLLYINRRLDKAIEAQEAGKDNGLNELSIKTVSDVITDTWKREQVEAGKPTQITETNVNELQLSLEAKLLKISSMTDIELLQADISDVSDIVTVSDEK